MKRQRLIVFLLVICMCVPICTPMLVFAKSAILPPSGVKVEFGFSGWPGALPESLRVWWQPSETDGITSYNIYKVITGEDGITEYVKVGGTNNTSCYIEGNIFGYHSFAVTSVMPDGQESDYSEIATGGFFDHLRVRDTGATSSNISIEWNDSPVFQDADSYEILYRVDDYEFWQYYDDYDNKKEIQYEIIGGIDGNTKSYTISGLQPDTEYVIMVRAYSNGEILDCSDFFQAKTESGFDEAILPPTDVKVEFGLLGWPGAIPESLWVRWKPSETDGITSYNIYEVITGEDGITEYVKVGGTNYTNSYIEGDIFGYHSFAVTSVMPDGRESDYSEIATGGLFYKLEVRDTGTTSSNISIEWDDSPAFQDADGYEIWYRVDDYEYWQYYNDFHNKKEIQYEIIGGIDGNTKSYTISGLQPDTEYVIMVRTYSNGEILDYSDFFQAKTEGSFYEVIMPPTGVKVDFILLGWPGLIPESLRVQWQPSETDGIASYNIYEVITGEDGITEYVKVGSTNETNCYIDGRFSGYHSFAVTSVMPDGRESDYSEIAAGGMFYHLRVRNTGATSSSISIEWDSPEFQDADGYEILYRVDDYEYWQYYGDYYGEKKIQYKKIGDIDGNTKNYTINGLQPDTEYIIMVLAYSNGKILDCSDFLRAKTMSGFVENKINISRASIAIEKTVYNGKVQKPKVTVKYNGKKLSLNKDFTVTYKNSKNVGKAKATITGIGNYTGTKSIGFTILPKANKVSKLTYKKAGKLVVKISKSKGVKGYEISYATNKKFTSARKKKTTGTSVTLKSIKKNKTYYVRVRAYAKIDGKTVYSSYSPVESIKIRK